MTAVAAPASVRRPSAWLVLLLWLATTAAVVFAAHALPWQATVERVRRLEVGWLYAAVFAYVLPLGIWAREWQLLAPGTTRVPYARMFEVVATMAAVLNSVPFFAGEASGVAMLVTRAGLSRGAALSVLATDQFLGGLVKLLVLGAAVAFVPLPVWLRAGVVALVIGVAVMALLLMPMAHRWRQIHARLAMGASRLRAGVARLIALGRHLDALRDTGRIARISTLAIARKLVELLAILAVQMAFGLAPSPSAAMLVLAALAIGTMVPVAPANIGVYEATVFAAYRYLGFSADLALGLAVVQHLCFLAPMLGTGYLTLTARQVLPLLRAR